MFTTKMLTGFRGAGTAVRIASTVVVAAVLAFAHAGSPSNAATCSVAPSGTCAVAYEETSGRQTQWGLKVVAPTKDFRVTLEHDDGDLYIALDSDDVMEGGACIGTVWCDDGLPCDCVGDGDEVSCGTDDDAKTSTCASYVAADETWYFDICEC